MPEVVNFYSNSKGRRGQYLATFLACGGSFVSGSAIGWSSSVYHRMVLSENGDTCFLRFCVYHMTFMWIISVLTLGGMLISIFTGIIIHHLGAKGGQFIFIFPLALGWISTLFARTEIMIYAGRFFSGLSCGAYAVIIPIYINEIADKKIRGRCLAWSQFMQNVGICFAFGLGLVTDIFYMNMICASITIVHGIFLAFLPESPVHLVQKDETDQAIRAMRKLYGTSYDCVTEVARLVRAKTPVNFEDALVSEWKLLLKNKSNRRALYIVIGLCFFLHMSGIYPIIFTLSKIFDSCQTNIDSNVIALIISATMLITSLICVLIIDFVGRRKLLLFSTAGMIVMGCIIVAQLYFELCCGTYMDEFKDLSIVFVSLYTGFASIGLGSVTFVIMAEIFTSNVSHLAMSLNIMINYVLMFAVTMAFYPLLHHISLVGVFAFFTLVSALAFVFVIFAVAETNGKSHKEIENILQGPSLTKDCRKQNDSDSEMKECKGIDIKAFFQ